MAATVTLVCRIHTSKELTKLGSCVSCRKRVQGIPRPESAPKIAQAPPTQAQETVQRLLETVERVQTEYAPERDQQVREITSAILSPQKETPVKRGRGRPRKYAGDTVQERDRNRKHAEQEQAKAKLIRVLKHFELEWDSPIPPGLKTKYGLEVDTYRQLLEEAGKKEMTSVFREITQDLKIIGKVVMMPPMNKKTGLALLSHGEYISDAPAGRGKLVLQPDPSEIHGVIQYREASLSGDKDAEEYLGLKEKDGEEYLSISSPLSSENVEKFGQGRRRKVKPEGYGPGEDEPDDPLEE